MAGFIIFMVVLAIFLTGLRASSIKEKRNRHD